MSRKLIYHSNEEVKDRIRKEAMKLCEELSPIAVEIEIIDGLRNVKVFVRCR